jgi:hypothetical protein
MASSQLHCGICVHRWQKALSEMLSTGSGQLFSMKIILGIDSKANRPATEAAMSQVGF